VTPKQLAALRAMRRATGLTVAELVRRAIDAYLERKTQGGVPMITVAVWFTILTFALGEEVSQTTRLIAPTALECESHRGVVVDSLALAGYEVGSIPCVRAVVTLESIGDE
jgi:hypothetical protein